MRKLDRTDLEILRLLVENARRPFSEIAEHVGLSSPTVSNRVTRLEKQGIIRNFTVDIDRTKLQRHVPVIIELRAIPGTADRMYDAVNELDGTEHAFQTFDGGIIAHANTPDNDVNAWLQTGIDMSDVAEYEIKLLNKYEWNPGLIDSEFALTCVVCGNPVRNDGVTTKIAGEIKAFCCSSCEERYETRYEKRDETAE